MRTTSVAATLCTLIALVPLSATSVKDASSDPSKLLQQMVIKLEANDRLAKDFTYVENQTNINYDKDGKITFEETAKFETVFVEGVPYRRQTEANGKPLSGEAAAEEERRYQATVAERRRMNSELKQTKQHRRLNSEVDWYSWPMHFLAMWDGVEKSGNRTITRLRLTPKPGVKTHNDAEKDALHTSIQLWIDSEDLMPVHVRIEHVSDGAHFKRGSITDLFFVKEASHGVYLASTFICDCRARASGREIRVRSEQQFSDYRHFGVDIRMDPEKAQQR